MKKTFIFFVLVLVLIPVFVFAQNYGQSFGGQQTGGMGQGRMGGLSGLGGVGNSKSQSFKKDPFSPMGDLPQNGGGRGVGEGSVGGESLVQYQIHVLGQVANPGTNRLPPSTRLDEAINVAGGVVEKGSLRNIELRRNGVTTHFDLLRFRKKGDLSQNPFLLDNDVVFVPYAESNVSIQGPVRSSGVYELTAREKSVWDVVDLAGGFSVGVTNNEPVVVIRFVDGKKTLIKINNTKEELVAFSVQNGDIIIVPHLFGEKRRFDYDILELPADNVFYPSQRNEIFVTGAVAQPGPYAFNPNYSVHDFTNYAGLTEASSPRAIYVVTSDGKVIKHPERASGFYLSPGDSIVVPKKQWTTDNVLKWYNTMTGTVFTAFAFKQLLKSQ